MQTTTLPIQVSNASAGSMPQRANTNSDAAQFSAALSREIDQRQAPQPAPVPAPKPAVQPKQADKPASAEPKSAAQPARPAGHKTETSSADAGNDADEAAESAQASSMPVADMLALVASFNQPVQNAAAAGEAAVAAALGSAGGKAGAEAGQLAALQAAVKALHKDSGDASAKSFAALDDLKNPGGAALGVSIAADQRPGAATPADLRAAAEFAATQPKVQAEAAFGAQVREAVVEAAALKDAAPVAPIAAQAQAATLEVAQAATAGPDRLSARVGTTAWDNQVGQKVVWMVAGKEQSATLTLNPPDLGPVQVVLNVTNDLASVSFSSNQEEVRQALENALPRLREMMSESGIALGNADVNAGMPDQRQAQDGQQPRGAASWTQFGSDAAATETVVQPATRSTAFGDRGVVDTFA